MTEEKQAQARPHPPPPPSRPNLPVARGSSPAVTVPKAPSSSSAVSSPHPPVVAATVGTAASRREAPPSSPTGPDSGRFSQSMIENALVELTTWRREVDRRLGQIETVVAQLHAARHAGGQGKVSEDVPVEWSAPPPAPAGAAFPAAGPAWGLSGQPAQPKPAVRKVPQYDLTIKPGETIDIPGALNSARRKKLFGWLFVIFIVAGVGGLLIAAVMSNR